MTDFDKSTNDLERRRFAFRASIIISFITFLILLIVYTFEIGLLRDPDTYWHIKTGEWIVSNLAIPRIDNYSYLYSGNEWIAKEWLSQVVLYISYNYLGWRGVSIISMFAIISSIFLFSQFLLYRLRFTIALGLITVSIGLASGHFVARPHIFGSIFMIAWWIILVNASERRSPPPLISCLLISLWANFHGGFTLGLLIAGIMAAEAVWQSSPSSRVIVLKRWVLFLVASTVAGCLTPYGINSMLVTVKIYSLGPVLRHVQEWRSVDFRDFWHFEIWLLFLLSMALIFGSRINPFRVIVLIGLLHLSLTSVRGIMIFSYSVPILLASQLTRQFGFLRFGGPIPEVAIGGRPLQWQNRHIVFTIAAVVIIGSAAFHSLATDQYKPMESISPNDALLFAKENYLDKYVLNHYNFGGFLIFNDVKTFIDGRAEFYGKEFVLEYINSSRGNNNETIPKLAEKYGTTWTLFPPDTLSVRQLDASDQWSRAYSDDVAVIHTKSHLYKEQNRNYE